MYFILTLNYQSNAVVKGSYGTFEEILNRLEEYKDSLHIIDSFEIEVVKDV